MATSALRKTTKKNSLLHAVPAQSAGYAQCRSLGHEWRHKGPMERSGKLRAPYSVDSGSIPLVSQCSDCKTWRTKWITRSGEVLSRYEYPDGYATHGDDRRTSREWRASFVATLFDNAAFTAVSGQ